MRQPRVGRSGALPRLVASLALAVAGAAASAAPYVPKDDAAVLEHVPARSALEALRPLRAAVAARPQDAAAALELAQGFIEIGRREGDPRFVAYAEPVLAPWVDRPQPLERALLLEATALQYRHQFGAALALLDRALALAPLDGQAWLTRASLLELGGAYAEARRACARLTRAADPILALTCLASVDSRSGSLAASYAALRQVAGDAARLPPPTRAWVLTVLADMAERSGQPVAAEAHLVAALATVPDDPYVKAAYADRLLAAGRPTQVVALLQGAEAQDSLLLRLAIAARRSGDGNAARWASMYGMRLRAARRDGDLTHLREQALFLLEVADEPRAALQAAAANFRVQREPIDVRLYLQAAERAQSPADRAAALAWVAAAHYEDCRVATP